MVCVSKMSSTDGDDKLDVLQTPQEQVHKDLWKPLWYNFPY